MNASIVKDREEQKKPSKVKKSPGDDFRRQVAGDLMDLILITPSNQPVTKRLLLAVALLTENDGFAYAKVEQIAELASCDRVSGYALLRRLKEQGIVIQRGSYQSKSYAIDPSKIGLISEPYDKKKSTRTRG